MKYYKLRPHFHKVLGFACLSFFVPALSAGAEEADAVTARTTTNTTNTTAPVKALRFALEARLGGARYKPASRDQLTKIRRSNFAHDFSIPDADALSHGDALSRSDQVQSLALAIRAKGGNEVFYELEGALLLQQGEYRFRRGNSRNGEPRTAQDPRPDALSFLPGDDLRLGFRFCESHCELSLGREAPEDGFANELNGGHGSLTGLHVRFVHPGYGSVRITPLYRPELSGAYYRASTDEAGRANGSTADSLHRLRSDFLDVAGKSRSYGNRVAAALRLGPIHIGLDYAVHRQNDTANPGENAPIESGTARFRRSVDHIQYAGLGLGFRGEILSFTAHLQRGSGSYRTLLARPSVDFAADETLMERKAPIAGSALRSTAGLRFGAFSLGIKFFLPEPSAKRAPGEAAGSQRSGYIGFGDTPLESPMLAGVLNFRPTPELCPRRGLCEGLAIKNFTTDHISPAPAGGAPVESDFRDHAAVFTLRVAFDFGDFVPDLTASLLAPLAPLEPGGRTPFQRIKKDPGSFEYREFELGGRWIFPGEGSVSLRYSRLYRRHRAAGTTLAGEHLRLLLRYRF